jgi:AraC-like DNA-binding protein
MAFLRVANQIGAPTSKYLQSLRLPTDIKDIVSESRLLLPEIPMWKLIHLLSKKEGIDNYGRMAGKTLRHDQIIGHEVLTSGCVNLHDLMKRFCELAPLYSNSKHYLLEYDATHVYFSQKGKPLLMEDIHVQQFKVLGLIQIVQMVMGQGWRPERIHFSFAHRADVENEASFNPSRIYFSQPYPSIIFSKQLLSTHLPGFDGQYKANRDQSTNSARIPYMPSSISEGVREVIKPYLGINNVEIDHIAEILGTSRRTLQRRLAKEGVSYTQVFDQARLMQAETLLKERNMKLVEISLVLGYQNASSFTRAFHRWAGVSPREYRHTYIHKEH